MTNFFELGERRAKAFAALERLVAANEDICCNDATEKGEGRFPDEDAVMAGIDGDDMRLTFGMIRDARKALEVLA